MHFPPSPVRRAFTLNKYMVLSTSISNTVVYDCTSVYRRKRQETMLSCIYFLVAARRDSKEFAEKITAYSHSCTIHTGTNWTRHFRFPALIYVRFIAPCFLFPCCLPPLNNYSYSMVLVSKNFFPTVRGSYKYMETKTGSLSRNERLDFPRQTFSSC